MRKIYLSIFTSLLLMLGLVNVAQADEYLRIGMEAAYAPFNWTQDDDSNGAVKILSLIHISEPTRHFKRSRMPSSA